MSDAIDALTVNVEENGTLLTKETGKVILSRGAWATILFRYQQWDEEKQCYGPQKYVIRRYKKWGGEYSQQSKFAISSDAQAQRIATALLDWIEADKAKEEQP